MTDKPQDIAEPDERCPICFDTGVIEGRNVDTGEYISTWCARCERLKAATTTKDTV